MANTPIPAPTNPGPTTTNAPSTPAPAPVIVTNNTPVALAIVAGAIIIGLTIGLPVWWATRNAPAATPTEQVAEVVPPPPVDVEYRWLQCDQNAAVYRGAKGSKGVTRIYQAEVSTSELGIEELHVSGLVPKRVCVTPEGDGDGFELNTDAVLTDDGRCVVGDTVSPTVQSKWLCVDRSGQFVSVQDLEKDLATTWHRVPRLEGVLAKCCPGSTLNGCKLKEGKIASR